MVKDKLDVKAKQDFADMIVFGVLHGVIANMIERATRESVPINTVSKKDLKEIKRIAAGQLHSLILFLKKQSRKSKK